VRYFVAELSDAFFSFRAKRGQTLMHESFLEERGSDGFSGSVIDQ
jgi:hypothetical protein